MMLELCDSNGTRHRFYLVDVHHHIGAEKNEKGAITTRNLNPREADGSYDRMRSILSGNPPYIAGLSDQLQDRTKFKYFWDPSGGPVAFPTPFINHFTEGNAALQGDFNDTFAVDLVCAFPMQDSFRGDKSPEYRSSNERISKIVNTFPHSLRFVGFGRVNPREGEKAVTEVERLVKEEGLCGLKLHPKSESFTIDTPEVKEVIKAAARMGIPVIFHTDWAQHLEDIRSVANQIITDYSKAGTFEAIRNLRLIIGHCGFSFDPHMFEVLAHPCIFGELSGLHGEGPRRFVQMARESYDPKNFTQDVLPGLAEKAGMPAIHQKMLQQATMSQWSRKLLFGSDFPFLNQNGTIELLSALFSKSLDLSPGELQSILGINALSIIPPKYPSQKFNAGSKSMKVAPIRRMPGRGLVQQFVKKVLDAQKAGWTVAGLDYLIDEGKIRRVRTRQAVLTLMRRDGIAARFLLTLMTDDGLEIIHPVGAAPIPGMVGRQMQLGDKTSCEAHLNALLGTGPWKDEDLTGIDSLLAVNPAGV